MKPKEILVFGASGQIGRNLIRKLTKKPLDVHLMIVEPEKYVTEFINLGSDIITVHIEATNNLNQIINKIHESSLKAGIAINPETPISELKEYIKKVDLICLMGVNPGFAGQKFIESTYSKISDVREMIDAINPSIRLEVDGGINLENIGKAAKCGADTFVAGSAIFNSKNYTSTISQMREIH